MSIEPLADRPVWIPEIAGWFRREWPEASALHDPAERLRRFCARDRIPMTLVAVERDLPVGTVSLLLESVGSHAHLSPWVGGLYVVPAARHRGVATMLIASAVATARRLDVSTLYIGVSAARDFYEGSAWTFVGDGRAGEEEVMVFAKDTAQ